MKLEGKNLSFTYDKKQFLFRDIHITVESGECVAILARSGFGKSTLGKILSGHEVPASGEVLLDGKPLPKKGFCPVQLIHQHPEKAVNPHWKIKKILSEGGQFHEELFDALQLEKRYLSYYPWELSGGQLQRICIARALQEQTKFLIADEITTMLDGVTQVSIWKFLKEEMKRRQGDLGIVVITHNHALAEELCNRSISLETLCSHNEKYNKSSCNSSVASNEKVE